MKDPHQVQIYIGRLLQEAELYEQQGLLDQAIAIYQSILKKQPDNRKAQTKVVQIRFNKQAAETNVDSSGLGAIHTQMSPRLALDLGIAYMGMNLYAEALDEFKKAIKPSPVFRIEILRYTAICYIHLGKFSKAETVLGQILQDRAALLAEKCDIVSEILNSYLAVGEEARARKIAHALYEAQEELVQHCDYLLQESYVGDITDELIVEDTETGLIYTEPLIEETTQDVKTQYYEQSLSLKTPVSYSSDSKSWKEGTTVRLAAAWAILDIAEPFEANESLVLQISLPVGENTERVWMIAKAGTKNPINEESGVKVNFISFLPGGESILKNFIEEGLSGVFSSEEIQSETAVEPVNIFAALEEEAIRAFEMDLLAEPVRRLESDNDLQANIDSEIDISTQDSTEINQDQPLKLRFSCECGQIHVVPMKSVGRRGKCGACGKMMTVPVMDMRVDSLSLSVVGKVVGGCRLLYKIGGGGMGGVFRGHHIALDIPVAVKILHAHLADKDPVFIKRFIREARSAAKLQHPNIVGVMNVGFEDSLHFLIMPYIGGGSAAATLLRHGRFRLERVLHIAIDITRALTVAEEQGMLHRDIKPANILFTPKGDAMLADLGLAKNYLDAQDAGITQSGIACGTPLYFSPEQAKGSPRIDIRSDIYSLGITLFHLLEGSPPYKGESAYIIFQKHVREPLPVFKEADPPVPAEVFKLLLKMTAKDPNNRYPTSQSLLSALEALRVELLKSGKARKKRGLLERLGLRRSQD